MRNKYPIQNRRPNERRNNLIPVAQQPNLTLPTAFNVLNNGSRYRDHSVGGQVITKVHLKDRNGNQMTLCQRQQVLNIAPGDKNYWHVGESDHNHRQSRRYKHVKR